MPIDPKKIAEWTLFVEAAAPTCEGLPEIVPGVVVDGAWAHLGREAVPALLAERKDMASELGAVRGVLLRHDPDLPLDFRASAPVSNLLAEREELLKENDRLRAGIGNHVPHGAHPEDVHDFQCLACRILRWPFAGSSRR